MNSGNVAYTEKNISIEQIISHADAKSFAIKNTTPFISKKNAKKNINPEGIMPKIPYIQKKTAAKRSIVPRIFIIIVPFFLLIALQYLQKLVEL